MKSRPPVARRPWMAGGMGTDGVGTATATALSTPKDAVWTGPPGPMDAAKQPLQTYARCYDKI